MEIVPGNFFKSWMATWVDGEDKRIDLHSSYDTWGVGQIISELLFDKSTMKCAETINKYRKQFYSPDRNDKYAYIWKVVTI